MLLLNGVEYVRRDVGIRCLILKLTSTHAARDFQELHQSVYQHKGGKSVELM